MLFSEKLHWYPRRDLNPHAVTHYHLKVACLPIPPPGHLSIEGFALTLSFKSVPIISNGHMVYNNYFSVSVVFVSFLSTDSAESGVTTFFTSSAALFKEALAASTFSPTALLTSATLSLT